jgi:hypothetical protein
MKRLENQEEVFFENSFDEIAFKANPKEAYKAKQKNGKPYKIEIGNAVLTEAILEGKLISKAEYEKY